jgi:hypothetical protein
MQLLDAAKGPDPLRDGEAALPEAVRYGNDDRGIEYHWTLIGTNTGPGGTDQAEYDRQIAHGADQD